MAYELKSGAIVDGELKIPSLTTAERTAMSGQQAGTLVWDTDTNSIQMWNGGSWREHLPYFGHGEAIVTGSQTILLIKGQRDQVVRYQGTSGTDTITFPANTFGETVLVWVYNESSVSVQLASSGGTINGDTTLAAGQIAIVVLDSAGTKVDSFVLNGSSSATPSTLETGQVNLPPSFVSFTATSFTKVGNLSITLPKAGKYRVYANLSSVIYGGSGDFGFIVNLYDVTHGTYSNADGGQGRLRGGTSAAAAHFLRLEKIYTVTGPTTIEVRAYRYGTMTSSYFLADNEGNSCIGYEEIPTSYSLIEGAFQYPSPGTEIKTNMKWHDGSPIYERVTDIANRPVAAYGVASGITQNKLISVTGWARSPSGAAYALPFHNGTYYAYFEYSPAAGSVTLKSNIGGSWLAGTVVSRYAK
ncbi:MAG: hypothetical protein D6816_01235 [Bacteroidetes bacterium]|nr:MAG: hypothetical protein D6816_01235 [Bacteroidota bacterium]